MQTQELHALSKTSWFCGQPHLKAIIHEDLSILNLVWRSRPLDYFVSYQTMTSKEMDDFAFKVRMCCEAHENFNFPVSNITCTSPVLIGAAPLYAWLSLIRLAPGVMLHPEKSGVGVVFLNFDGETVAAHSDPCGTSYTLFTARPVVPSSFTSLEQHFLEQGYYWAERALNYASRARLDSLMDRIQITPNMIESIRDRIDKLDFYSTLA